MPITTDSKNIEELILGDLKLFHIPVYQRDYTWEAKIHVNQLLEDIAEFGKEYKDNPRAEYYIGNIIIKDEKQERNIKRLVVDGQQRITTIILMLCAIRDIYKQSPTESEEYKFATTIQKSIYSYDDGIKLKINNMNNQQELTALLSGEASHPTQTSYTENYRYMLHYFQQMGQKNFEEFVGLLRRVKTVAITLDDDQDENAVFESINSLGKPLTGADLIKNYLFTFKYYQCDFDCETRLINLYTEQFEKLFDTQNIKDVSKEIESFFRIYIAIKTETLHKQEAKIIYYQFKKTIGDITSVEQCREILQDLYHWAFLYQTLKTGNHSDINANHLGFMQPVFLEYAIFLMQVLNAYSHMDNHQLIIDDKEKFNHFLKIMVGYQASRFIAKYPTINPRFIPIAFRQLENGYFQYDNYADKFLALVSNTDNGYRIPSYADLLAGALVSRLYGKINIKSLLILLDNIDKKELLNYEKNTLKQASIEHIMPQTLSDDWKHIPQDSYKDHLHVLGNLTLTMDNSKLSNLGFGEKKAILLEKSRITLNNDLQNYETFDIDTINQRGFELLKKFIKAYRKDINQ